MSPASRDADVHPLFRVIDFDVRQRFWALDAIVDAVVARSETYRAKIAARSKLKVNA